MALSAVTLGLFPWGGGSAGWFVLRLVNGMASAISLIPLETLISRSSEPAVRTRNFAFYGVALMVGGAIGIGLSGVLLALPGAIGAFCLGVVFPLVGAVVLARLLPAAITSDQTTSTGPVDLARNFLSYGTAWSQGFLEGGMIAFLALYLQSLDISRALAGGFMGAAMIGVILFQVPVSWLADRFGRVPVLLACYAVAGAGLLLAPHLGPSIWLALCLFAFGACSGAMYPLGLALLGDRLPEAALARAYSWYMAMECVGSQLGAAAMGKARDLWGEGSMFGVGFAALSLVLVGWIILQLRQRRGEPLILGDPAFATYPPAIGVGANDNDPRKAA